ncbi:hypothetical protein C8Q80DRAFT_1196772 [Daedaleopsis nitida]|nr:hypothetical protein C8Q80DRAFT_1196772 [Daedaleopsis nitida]
MCRSRYSRAFEVRLEPRLRCLSLLTTIIVRRWHAVCLLVLCRHTLFPVSATARTLTATSSSSSPTRTRSDTALSCSDSLPTCCGVPSCSTHHPMENTLLSFEGFLDASTLRPEHIHQFSEVPCCMENLAIRRTSQYESYDMVASSAVRDVSATRRHVSRSGGSVESAHTYWFSMLLDDADTRTIPRQQHHGTRRLSCSRSWSSCSAEHHWHKTRRRGLWRRCIRTAGRYTDSREHHGEGRCRR